MGFEPTCRLLDNCVSSAARYDHFDTAPDLSSTSVHKNNLGKRRELMERTKSYSVVNDTLKAPENQGFSVKRFQNGSSLSSAARYDHFDTTPKKTSLNIILDLSINFN